MVKLTIQLIRLLSQHFSTTGLLWQAEAECFPDRKANPRWRGLHASMYPDGVKPLLGSACSADDLFLHLPRERDAWNILQAARPGEALVADLSQTVTRAGVRTDGSLPTITPGSVLAMRTAKRVVSPLEKIMLHGFPIHRMKFPAGLSDKELEKMGGNTMHVHVVGAAMVMALAMVDWSLPAAAGPCAAKLRLKSMQKVQGPRSTVKPIKLSKRSKLTKKRSQATSVMAALAARWHLQQPRSKAASVIRKAKSQAAVIKKPFTRFPALKGTRWG